MMILIFAGILASVGLAGYVIMGKMKKTRYRNVLDELEILKYEISNKPVLFEIAKLRSVRKSERIVSLVGEWEKRWQDLEEQIGTVEGNMTYAEELISASDFEKSETVMDATRDDLMALAEKVEVLVKEIETLKTSESRNREGIVKLKEELERLQSLHGEGLEIFDSVDEQIKSTFATIDELFVQFDENMESSNYDLADEASELIKGNVEMLSTLFERVPMYFESVELEIKPLLTGLLDSHKNMVANGIYLDHLSVEEVVAECKKKLKKIIGLVQIFNFDKVETVLIEVTETAKKTRDLMKNELDVKEAFEEDLSRLKSDLDFIVKESEDLSSSYDSIKESCLMGSEDEENFESLLREISILNAGVNNLLNEVEIGDKATSEIHSEVVAFLKQMEEIKEQLKIFDDEIDILYKDSKDVRNKAMLLIDQANQLKVEFDRTVFPDDNKPNLRSSLNKLDEQISLLFESIKRVPIDVEYVKKNLKTAGTVIDEVGKVIMIELDQLKLAERLLVYGNRYTGMEGMYLMDLTIAEDQFKQGNYQTVIDKMYKILTDVEGNTFYNVFEDLKKELKCSLI